MCQSYRKICACGQNTSEIFFGREILDEQALSEVYCPKCSENIDSKQEGRVWDNGWIIEFDMDVIRVHAPQMGISSEEITAHWVFDEGFATWVGITPDDFQTREQERSEIQKLAKTDVRAYIQALKEWGVNREKRFVSEGWRKVKSRA